MVDPKLKLRLLKHAHLCEGTEEGRVVGGLTDGTEMPLVARRARCAAVCLDFLEGRKEGRKPICNNTGAVNSAFGSCTRR